MDIVLLIVNTMNGIHGHPVLSPVEWEVEFEQGSTMLGNLALGVLHIQRTAKVAWLSTTQFITLLSMWLLSFLVEGAWSSWKGWSSCSTSCGQGAITRSREHSAGPPCSGSSTDTASCQGWLKNFHVITYFYALFSVEGSWANWEVWTSCSTSCGQGTKSRSRVHSAGPPCSGSSTETESCQGT